MAYHLNAAQTDNSFLCKNGQPFSTVTNGVTGITHTTSSAFNGSGNSFNYDLNSKLKMTANIKSVCTGQGVLSNNLGNLASATYDYNCRAQPKVVLSYTIRSKGKANLP